ncbi:hypothetical protein ACQPZP_04500 [Spirillospora sp. CA-142024]|uniref:hypothetical protein n=1 Tax=Spirillospora sp. CA-142024 TaxID=3240036 RepID=UPI003D932001
MLVGLRGPETKATTAPVPPDAEFLGIRFALGTVLRPHSAASIIDRYASFPVTDSGRIAIGGEDWEAPTYETVEHFVRRPQDAGLLVRSRLGTRSTAPSIPRPARPSGPFSAATARSPDYREPP